MRVITLGSAFSGTYDLDRDSLGEIDGVGVKSMAQILVTEHR